MFDEADWYVVSESDTELALVGVAKSASPEAPEYTFASLRRQGDHWVPVVLASDETSVSIVVLVEPVSGAATCESNPSFPIEIDLGEPLGDRTIQDASVDPPLDRPWPPTRSSLDDQGLAP